MAILGGFVLDSAWYWRIFEGEPMFADAEAELAARDFLQPLARLAQAHVAIDQIAVDPDGDGVQFRIGARPIAIRCRGLRVERFIEAINRGLSEAEVDLAFAIVESRRYELRGVLHPRSEPPRRFASGTLPPGAS